MDFTEFSKYFYRELKFAFLNALSDYYDASEANAVFHYWILEKNQWSLKDWINHLDEPIKNPEQLWSDFQKLLNKMPVQYVVNRAYFMGLPFYVNSFVLIPRPETESLVREIQKKITLDFDGTILDIGTGSGCIALALKKKYLHSNIYGIDVSKEALEVAQKNAESLNVSVNWICRSIFDFQNIDFQNVEIIISNPPYIPLEEKNELKEHVKNFEPHTALFSGPDPLHFYQQITHLAKHWLKKQGILAYEIHSKYALEIKELMEENGFQDIEVIKDDFQRERVILGFLS